MALGFSISFIVPILLSLFITPWIIKFALHINAMDMPGGRKIHTAATPRLGGLAVFSSISITVALMMLFYPPLFTTLSTQPWQTYLIPLCFLTIFGLGFWDDLKSLRPGVKFGIQFVVAAVVYFAGFKISNVTNPVGAGVLNVEMIDFPLTLFWIVGITNAFNLIDGLDGLASGVATIASLSIFIVSALAGEFLMAAFALIMAGALLGFLRYNFSPAKIFLGDSGSLFIGFSMALMSIHSTTKISTGFALLFPLLVLGFPITDTLISMLRRFLGNFLPERSTDSSSIVGKFNRMFTPDSSHIHHQLLSLGLTHRNTVLLLYFVSAFFALGAFAITRVENIEILSIIGSVLGFALFLGIKKLRYREIDILNNGIMLPIYERWILNRILFLGLIDLIFVAVSYTFSYKLMSSISAESVLFLDFEQKFIMLITIQLATFWLTGLYREKIKQMGIGDVLKITSSVGYAILSSAIALLILNGFTISHLFQFLILDFYFLLTLTLGIRIAYQALSYWFNRNKKSGENVLIYGANENGTMILHNINNSTQSNFKILGFLDDDSEMEGKLIYGYPVLGGHWKLTKTLRNMNVDYIFICEQHIKPENLNRLQRVADSNGIKVKRLHIRLKNVISDKSNKNKTSTTLGEPTISYF